MCLCVCFKQRTATNTNPHSASSFRSSFAEENEDTEEDRSEYTPKVKTETKKSLPSLVAEIEEDIVVADPPPAPAEHSGKKAKTLSVPAKTKPSGSNSTHHYQRKGKRSLPPLSSLP